MPWWRRAVQAVPLAVVAALLTACAPGTPDEDSWRADARRAVSDVSSQVEAARLALAQDTRGGVFAPYLQTVVVEAETNAGRSSEKFSGTQPPLQETSRYARVTDELDRDVGLLADVRIAVVAGSSEEYAGLAGQLSTAADRLTALDEQLRHTAESRSRP